jgi:CDP-diacylglycerol--inositol 3-phosphatidyltransferase
MSLFKTNNVYLFVPNLIGYSRVVAAVAAYAVALTHPATFLALYTASFVLDAADGMAARALDQCSTFGAILDMITDRAATSGLLVLLSHLMGSEYAFAAAMLIGLDFTSHFVRMYATLSLGGASHKDVGQAKYSFLALYYSNRTFMGALCVGQEFLYLALYARHFWPEVAWVQWAVYALAPLFAGKQLANLQQLLDGMRHLADDDAAKRSKQKK